ncbi:MAG: hypothetical protein KAJ03_11130, partial [Gammaproteobacteria bacterium]|nr:hypothetical protein [Gammaproteobacteria bacterium]
YSFRCERYLPSVIQTGRSEVRLNYHSAFMSPILANRWDNIIPSILNILSTDKVVVVGSGFGWGVDKLIELTGCTAVGVDISDYIETAKTTDENADLIAAIQLVGLDETVDRGLEVYNAYATTGARTISVVLKEDMLSNRSRNEVKKALGNAAPDYIITEDMIQEMSDVEIAAWVTEAEKLPGATIVHIIGRETPRTAEELNALTGHKVIVVGEYRVVG